MLFIFFSYFFHKKKYIFIFFFAWLQCHKHRKQESAWHKTVWWPKQYTRTIVTIASTDSLPSKTMGYLQLSVHHLRPDAFSVCRPLCTPASASSAAGAPGVSMVACPNCSTLAPIWYMVFSYCILLFCLPWNFCTCMHLHRFSREKLCSACLGGCGEQSCLRNFGLLPFFGTLCWSLCSLTCIDVWPKKFGKKTKKIEKA